jgi:hypothetical protein
MHGARSATAIPARCNAELFDWRRSSQQTEVDALVGGGVTTGVIYISDGAPTGVLAIGNVESSATPEPTTWISLALRFGMVGLVK